jgi:UDPglucose 6-dehydrogenase
VQTGEVLGAPQRIVEAVVQINANRQREMAERIIQACGGDVNGKRIGVLGVAFKPETDDVREAPSLVIIPILQEAGAIVAAYDPIAMEQAQKHLQDVVWCKDAYEVAEGSDAVAIITEWNEFRALDLNRLGDSMKQKRLLDLRNIYKGEELEGSGFHYSSIGRPDVVPDNETGAREKLRSIS